MKNIVYILLLIFPVTACASTIRIERKDYILSHPHGWVSLTITDLEIPNVLNSETKKLVKPKTCFVTLEANSEVFLSEAIYPDGDGPTYNVNTGFRFAIPTGFKNIKINYSGCKAAQTGLATEIESTMKLNISNNMVYEIKYSNGSFFPDSEKPDEEITLKQIYEAVKK